MRTRSAALMHTVLGLLLLGAVLAPTGEASYGGGRDEAAGTGADGPVVHVVHVAGERRTFVLFRAPTRGEHPPLIVALHGRGGSGAGFRSYGGWDDVARGAGAIVAYPDSVTEDGWRVGPRDLHDVRFLSHLVRRLVQRRHVDPRRVYVVGHSSGAFMAYRMACVRSRMLAGVGPVNGAMPDCEARPASVRVAAFRGTTDGIVPYGGEGVLRSAQETAREWARHDRCAPRPRREREGRLRIESWTRCAGRSGVQLTSVVGGGHEYPANASRRIWRFLAGE